MYMGKLHCLNLETLFKHNVSPEACLVGCQTMSCCPPLYNVQYKLPLYEQ